jgi:hypothetical protein
MIFMKKKMKIININVHRGTEIPMDSNSEEENQHDYLSWRK